MYFLTFHFFNIKCLYRHTIRLLGIPRSCQLLALFQAGCKTQIDCLFSVLFTFYKRINGFNFAVAYGGLL